MEKGTSNFGVIFFTIIIIAIVVGGGVYLWEKNESNEVTLLDQGQEQTTETSNKIVETFEYEYDINTGNLKSKNNNEIIYTFSDQGDSDKFSGIPAVYIYGLDGNKLILWQTGFDNSPGPGWEYEIWSTNELEYLDLGNPSQGPKPYIVPEWKKQEAKSPVDCSKLGSSWTVFSSEETSLSFCYKDSWGDTELRETGISPEARKGTVYHVIFSKSVNNSPLISYSTLDFQRFGDSGVPPINWEEIDLSKNETELAEVFKNENGTAQKLTVNGKQLVKIKSNFVDTYSQEPMATLHYFMPNVVINGTTYNLQIIGSIEEESDFDKLLDSMIF